MSQAPQRQRSNSRPRTRIRYLLGSAALVTVLAAVGCGGGGGGGGGGGAAAGGSVACQKMPAIWKTFLAAAPSGVIEAYNNLFGAISNLGAAGEINNQQLNTDLYNLSSAANNLGDDYSNNSAAAPADETEFKTEAKAVSAACGISLALPSF